MLGSSKGSGDGGGVGVPQLWEPGLNGVGQFLGDLNYLNFRAENNAMNRVSESVCVAKRIPALHFLAASQFVSLSRFGFPFFVNLLLRIHF